MRGVLLPLTMHIMAWTGKRVITAMFRKYLPLGVCEGWVAALKFYDVSASKMTNCDATCALLGYYKVLCRNCLLTFRDNVSDS
jgi:hypothetical protein